MTKKILYTLLFVTVTTLSSCIKNDLPKPVVDLYIATLDVEGTNGDITLDRSTYTATIPLAEETNIEAVKFNSITYGADVVTNVSYEADESQIVVSKDLNNRIVNMVDPEYITLSYFQSYEWKIVASQTINRIWTVDGQIGATEWDLEGHRATIKRRQDYPLGDVKTTAVRFGPRPTYDYPEIAQMPTDFDNSEKSRNITVSAHNRSTPWELVIIPTLAEPEFQYIGAGVNVIWIKANAIDGSEIVFKYRKKDEDSWNTAEQSWYATDANNPYNRYEEGYVKAVLRGLEPNTEYVVQGWSNTVLADGGLSEIPSKEFSVTTASHYQMPNSDMEQWGKFTDDQKELPKGTSGDCWYPFSSVQDMFWGTGNPGGASFGVMLTYPVYKSASPENVPSDSSSEVSAYMGSQNVFNIKFAAGNIFVGYFGGIIGGTNAEVYFGRPISQNVKPVAVRFKLKYTSGGINYVTINKKLQKATAGTEYHIGSKQFKVVGGQADLAKVFFCLTDWTAPHRVYSDDESTFFDPRTAEGVNGLGYFDSYNNPEMVVEHTNEWHTMTLPIEYSNPEVVPTYLVMTLTCSGYGDYFTGSDGSEMFVDDIELLYDLDENNQPK